jgi:ribose/xylose/arabinose/galactoside ABC-type transport system permease subunit
MSSHQLAPLEATQPSGNHDGGLAATPARQVAVATIRRSGAEHSGLLLALAVLFVFLSLSAENFLTTDNLLDILRTVAFTGIIAFGMTLVIVAAEIDISVGSAIGFASALLGVMAVNEGWPLGIAVVFVIVVGTAVGLAAGAIRARFGVPSFIVTLALFSALRGLALLITDAIPVSIESESFSTWGSGDWLGIPIPGVLLIVTFALFWLIANRTTFGRSVYAIGGNPEAAYLSGIPVARVRIALFGITGCLAAISGVLQTSELGAGNPNIGTGVEFSVISAVIVGGASLYGGRGTMFGTLLGVLFIGVLSNGMVLMGVDPYAQNVAHGLIVLIAVLISTLRTRPNGRRTLLGLRGRTSGATQ